MNGKTSYFNEMLKYELERIVGIDGLITDEAEIEAQSLDVWWVTRFWKFSGHEFPKPFAIVFPRTTDEVSRVVICNARRAACSRAPNRRSGSR